MLMNASLSAQTCGEVISEKTGQIIASGPCKEGLRDGNWYFFHDREGDPKTRVLAKGAYENGKKTGVWFTYYEDKGKCNKLVAKEAFTYVDDIKEGPAATFYPDVCDINKGIQFSGDYKNGKREGAWGQYDKEGTDDEHLEKVINYVNDKVTGKHYDYTNNGKEIVFEYTLEEGELELPKIGPDGKIWYKKFDGYREVYTTERGVPQTIEKRHYAPIRPLQTGLKKDDNFFYLSDSVVFYHPYGRVRAMDIGFFDKFDKKLRFGKTSTTYRSDGKIESLTLSFKEPGAPQNSEQRWTVSFHPNQAIDEVFSTEYDTRWQYYDDGSMKSKTSYSKAGNRKVKEFKRGKKFPDNTPEWQKETLENIVRDFFLNTEYYRIKLEAFFDLVDKTRK